MKFLITLLFTIAATICSAQTIAITYDLLYQDSVVMLTNCKVDTLIQKPDIVFEKIIFGSSSMKIISPYKAQNENWTAYGHANDQLYAIRYREFPYTLWLTPIPFHEKQYFYNKGYIITDDLTIKCPN